MAVHVLIAGVVVAASMVRVVAVVGPIGVVAAVIAPVVAVVAVIDWSPDGCRGEEIIGGEAHLITEHRAFCHVEGRIDRIAVGGRRRIIDIAHPGRVVVTGPVDDGPVRRHDGPHIARRIADLDRFRAHPIDVHIGHIVQR